MTTYVYTKALVDTDRLSFEITISSITIALDSITVFGDQVSIQFKIDISTEEKSILDTIVDAHTGIPLIKNTMLLSDNEGNIAGTTDIGSGKRAIDINIHGASSIQVNNLTGSTPVNITNGTGATLQNANITIDNAQADGATKGVSTYTTSDFNVTSSGLVSIDYTNGQASDATHKGFLTSADWTIFNNKQGSIITGNLTGSTPVSVSGGTNAVIGTGANVTIADAAVGTKGVVALSNSYAGVLQTVATTEKALSDGLATKEPSLTKGNFTTVSPLSNTDGTGAVIGAGISISIQDASTSQKGATQLSNSYSGTSQTVATTEKALADGLLLKQAIDGDLTAISALTSTGIAVRTATDTWATRTIVAGSNKIGIANGNGVSGNPSIDIVSGNIDHTQIANIGTNSHSTIDSHLSNTSNPHSVTKTQVNLGNVTDDAQVKKITTSTIGNIPTWATSTSDTLAKGYGVDTSTLTNSSSKIPVSAVVKSYADSLVITGAMVYKGVINCSGSPDYPASTQGWTYVVSVAGLIGGASGVSVEIGDVILCITTNAGGTQAAVGANFDIIQMNIVGAVTGPTSSVTNRVASFNGTTGKVIQDSGYLAQDASTSVKGFTQLSNSYSGTSQVLATTEKALSDGLATKEPTLTKGNLTGTTPISVTGGTAVVIGTGTSIAIGAASISVAGAVQLSNSYSGSSQTLATTEKAIADGLATREPSLTKGNLTAASTKITLGGTGTGAVIGSGVSIDVSEGNLTHDNIGGTLGIAKGGTGQTTANAALNALLPSQTGNVGKVLSTDGSNSSWSTSGTTAFSSKCRARNTSAQNINNSTWTKLQFNTEDFDVSNEYDAATNYRFTAVNAGYYQVNGLFSLESSSGSDMIAAAIYKNGSVYASSFNYKQGSRAMSSNISDIVYLAANGYIELYAYQQTGSTKTTNVVAGQESFISIHRLS
jgi:hypothetical protein